MPPSTALLRTTRRLLQRRLRLHGALRRLVELLSTGGSVAQQHAADALAHAMREPAAKAQIVATVQESTDAKELLAVLADSGNEGLAPQAVQLLESAEPGASGGKRKAELKRNGLAILFNRQKQEGWVVPSEEEEHGWSLCPEWRWSGGGEQLAALSFGLLELLARLLELRLGFLGALLHRCECARRQQA